MKNTIGLSLYSIAAGFTPPIILAIALNECRHRLYRRTVQMVTYMPYFISTVLVVGIMLQVLSLRGIVNTAIHALGLPRLQFLGDPAWFKTIFVFSGIWQRVGYSAIIYLAALANVDPELYEAAVIDGASIWKRIWHIDIPGIAPTAIILLILSTARVLNVGFEKVFLLQNPLNMSASDVISTYVYRMGLVSMQYGFATAVGLFQSVVSFILLIVVNRISKKTSEISLW
jgi:putative aldouronate transport system permease protein